MTSKRCPKCERLLDLGKFSKNRSKKDGHNSICKECYNKYQTSPRTKLLRRRTNFKSFYGASEEQWEHYLQVTTCESCGKEFKTSKDKHQDHNHDTGEVRKVLCRSCNQAFGLLEESPERIQRLLEYAKLYS